MNKSVALIFIIDIGWAEFCGQNFNFNILWVLGKNDNFLGLDIFVDIFGALLILTIFMGYF